MRIVGGIYKGRVLNGFNGNAIRPTADMVRESLFNILQFNISGKKFLDICCGTGAMGIEALSRGAEYVHFNDVSKESLNLTKSNLQKLKIEKNYKITNFEAKTLCYKESERFDIIFIDPPYNFNFKKDIIKDSFNLLNKGGIIVFEDEKPFNDGIENLEKYDERKYGRVYLNFFRGIEK